MRQTTLVRQGTAQANTGQTDVVTVPAWATNMLVFLNVSAAAGTTPLTDFKMQYRDPTTNAAVLDFPGAGITQIAGTTTANVVIQVGPGITGIADDDTTQVYSINMALPSEILFITTLDRTTGDETYTYSINAQFSE
jgi:hypothetical protein